MAMANQAWRLSAIGVWRLIPSSDRHQPRSHLPKVRANAWPPMTTAETTASQSPATASAEAADPRALTLENVERALDELRPYLMADGGNVEVVEIDGPIVKVRLQGACGSCPSSTMTLKMGIERKLREAIPEVSEVVQVL
jgi:Fe-S cluster biogenesis protein NfuA